MSHRNDHKEFESLLSAFSERQLTQWEQERLWKLLKDSPERVEIWQEQCRVVTVLESLTAEDCAAFEDELPPSNVIALHGTDSSKAAIGSSPVGRKMAIWSIAALLVLAGVCLAVLSNKSDSTADKTSIAGEGLVPSDDNPAEPLSEAERLVSYETKVANLPIVASQNRPPSDSENAGDIPHANIDFNNDIRPILADKCFHCHGPDEHSRKADLRLDTKEGAFADLGGYFAIKPGDAEDSEIVHRLFEDDPDSIMPPPEFHKPLSKEEKRKIVAWVNAGAEWKGHWSFEAIAKPEPPKVDGIDEAWSRNPIDSFILAGMQSKGLQPNPEADRYSLARRAALDIIGLPPTPEQLKQFLDDSSEDAYSAYVDRLLDSVHYGEHQARFWLDAARYGDTHGMHLDNYREMWAYRDWVINAFNDNQSFDQFSIEQLAGDLFDNPTVDQLVATGFNRNHITTAEGGAIPAELAMRYMVDRTETMSTVYLGLTTGCAACHDHKYDPISQKDFYSLAAFFGNGTDPAMDGNRTDHYPTLVMPKAEHEKEWSSLNQKRSKLLTRHRETLDKQKSGIASWWDERQQGVLEHPVDASDLALYLPLDHFESGKTKAVVAGESKQISIGKGKPAKQHPHGPRGLRFEEPSGIAIPMDTPFHPNSPATISFWVRTPEKIVNLDLLRMDHPGKKEEKVPATGWTINCSGRGGITASVIDGKGTAMRNLMPAETPLKSRSWQHVAIRYGGGEANRSIHFFVDGERRHGRQPSAAFSQTKEFAEHLPRLLKVGNNAPTGGISDVRIFSRALADEEMGLLANEFELRKLSKSGTAFAQLDKEEQALISKLFAFQSDTEATNLNRQIMALQPRYEYLYARNPTTQVYQEKEKPAMTHIRIRGEYDKLGESVSANTPDLLPQLEADGSPNRLDLAKWLFQPEHPLTARVTVNRIWQSVFGTGIVKSAGDFGILGEKPTHPELLDYLASRYIESGWDTKALIRLLVTSATYRQSSHRDEEMLASDPENRYLSVGPRRRLDAEVIRDQVLAVSGILDRTVGGQSVKPYQPAGVWKPVAFAGSNTREFKQDSVEKIHRRSVYTFWKRTAHHPALAAFNAPNREECSVVRERTNTPLQALVLLNDVQHIEAARVLAETLLKKHGADPGARRALLDEAFLRVVGHPADEADRVDLLSLLEVARNQYLSAPKEAEKLHQVGDLPHRQELKSEDVASWTLLINALMNRDDVINQS